MAVVRSSGKEGHDESFFSEILGRQPPKASCIPHISQLPTSSLGDITASCFLGDCIHVLGRLGCAAHEISWCGTIPVMVTSASAQAI
jgi:hypothetical protein